MSEGRMLQATYNGRTYDIPEIWMAGCVRSLRKEGETAGAVILEATAIWAWQTELAERESSKDRSE